MKEIAISIRTVAGRSGKKIRNRNKNLPRKMALFIKKINHSNAVLFVDRIKEEIESLNEIVLRVTVLTDDEIGVRG